MSAPDPGSITVVIPTYEWPAALEVMLRALSEQKGSPFEVVVADDGSGEDTARVVERWRGRLDLQHVWQPNEGFRKARILDLGALKARGDYLVFLDGDCIPRRDFMNAVRRAAFAGWFLSTKRIDLREPLSKRVVEEHLPVWRWSAAQWLVRAPRNVGRPGLIVPARDRRRPWREGQPDFTPPAAAYCFVGVFREDFERVNGYDARSEGYNDGEDQDLAIRLRRSGLRCGWPGPLSTLVHLWHPHRKVPGDPSVPLFRQTEAGSHVEAVVGLRELARQASA